MKAITYSTYGPPEVLQLKEVDKPTPQDDEVLIRVQAAEATKSDVEMRSFQYSVKWFALPLRLVPQACCYCCRSSRRIFIEKGL